MCAFLFDVVPLLITCLLILLGSMFAWGFMLLRVCLFAFLCVHVYVLVLWKDVCLAFCCCCLIMLMVRVACLFVGC